MEFKRIFRPAEVKLFSDIGGIEKHMDYIISRAIQQREKTLNHATVESRILMVMSKTKPMGVSEIMRAHNALLYHSPISLNYTRSILSGMLRAVIINRTGHGKYVKGEDND